MKPRGDRDQRDRRHAGRSFTAGNIFAELAEANEQARRNVARSMRRPPFCSLTLRGKGAPVIGTWTGFLAQKMRGTPEVDEIQTWLQDMKYSAKKGDRERSKRRTLSRLEVQPRRPEFLWK